MGLSFHNFCILQEDKTGKSFIKNCLVEFANALGMTLTSDLNIADTLWQIYTPPDSSYTAIFMPEYEVASSEGHNEYLKKMSGALKSPVIYSMVFDSDVAVLQIADMPKNSEGILVYSNEEMPCEQSVEAFEPLLAEGSQTAHLLQIFSEQSVFAEDKIFLAYQMLGIPTAFMTTEWNEENPAGLEVIGFLSANQQEPGPHAVIIEQCANAYKTIRANKAPLHERDSSYFGAYFASCGELQGLEIIIRGKPENLNCFAFSNVKLFTEAVTKDGEQLSQTMEEFANGILVKEEHENIAKLHVSFPDFRIAQGKYRSYQDYFKKNLKRTYHTLHKEGIPQTFYISFDVTAQEIKTVMVSLHVIPKNNWEDGQTGSYQLISSDPAMADNHVITSKDIADFY